MIAGGDKAGYLSLSEATVAFDVRDRLGEIAVPTTIIHGEDDAPVPVARAAELRDGIPGAALRVLAGEGHFVNVQAPGKGQSAAGERAANTARSFPAAVGDLTSVAGVRF